MKEGKKGKLIIVSLIILVLAVSVSAVLLYSRNVQLEKDRAQISQDKENALIQLDTCRNQSQIEHTKLNMLMEDYASLKKSCITDNICKNKFPFMRYFCNAQGDAVDNGSLLCECDENCNLKIVG
ncbi:MAG: hypothetical protein PHH00_02895 [Candidatus Nanoarchaeia archaeon]|nr:hypothetical protein [Candidatus Nanoarchaeia archaeon]